MAKNRRGHRSRPARPAPRTGGGRARVDSGQPAPPAVATEEPAALAARVSRLRDEVEKARADAHNRAKAGPPDESAATASPPARDISPRPTQRAAPPRPAPRRAAPGRPPQLKPPVDRPAHPARARRGAWVVLIGVLAVIGVAVGLLATNSGPAKQPTNAVAVYLTNHVQSGTTVVEIGTIHSQLPAGYPVVALATPDAASLRSAQIVVAPDPLASIGSGLFSYVASHASLLAVDPGRSTLWMLHSASAASTLPTLPAPTTVPAPSPVAHAPPAATPPAAPAAPASNPVPSSTVVVAHGQSFWSIARTTVAQRLGGTPTDGQVTAYWGQLVAANSHTLRVPGNPNLIFPGQVLVLPSG